MGRTAVLVTGSSGFVGQALCHELAARGHVVHACVRNLASVPAIAPTTIRWVPTGDLSEDTDWRDVLHDFSQDHPDLPHAIIHCAARAHVMNEGDKALPLYQAINVGATLHLAEQATQAGINRLVFLSSVKVNGERTAAGQPFRDDDPACPEDSYGVSKWEAELALHDVAHRTELEVVIVRPPLVYGAGVKGNLLRLMKLMSRGFPLPLGSIHNRRAMVGIDNLVDLLILCTHHPKAAGRTFLVSDNEDLSTPALLRSLANHMNRKAYLLPVPVSVLRLLGRLTAKQSEVARLTDSLQVDCTNTGQTLGWTPPVQTQTGLKKMVDWYLSRS